MTDETEKPKPKLTLSLGGGAKPAAPRGGNTVTVEVRRKRVIAKPGQQKPEDGKTAEEAIKRIRADSNLSDTEKQKRLAILQQAAAAAEEEKPDFKRPVPTTVDRTKEGEEEQKDQNFVPPRQVTRAVDDEDDAPKKSRDAINWDKKIAKAPLKGKGGSNRKVTVTNFDQEERHRSLASIKRSRDKARRDAFAIGGAEKKEKIIREVIIPETITVAELANRMSEKSSDIIRSLMKLGVMATINEIIDADTAELVVGEFGHKFKRVTEADVENVIDTDKDAEETLQPRPPVVTVMGHVDHGKTSLLDALRKAKVAEGEAGGITQHIGAYQVALEGRGLITFIDTPGHAAFTEMRARGAKVTDIVVLVVAADDGIMEQTKEAISHAKAAQVPIIVAINKMDKPDANPQRVKNELLQHELVPEELGGEVLVVEVSAKTGLGLEKLKETILLQAEVLDLKANPNRASVGTVIESRIDKGRGVVATVIVQRGTLKVGDIVVAGTSFGKVRALLNDKMQNITEAPPAAPAEILGLDAAPMAGDEFSVLATEKQAREIVEYRAQKAKNIRAAAEGKSAMEKLMAGTAAGEKKTLAVVLKGDVQGSIEAISGSLEKLTNNEVQVKVIHSAVGAVTESDVILARASSALIIAFNVRANSQARELANRDKTDIRYYSIIYEVVDDVKAALTGLLSPVLRESFIGYVEIREVFNITRVGKVAGCYVTEGFVKRGAGVRLLRDNVVIHQGKLKTLKRFKDEVKEVQSGYECGMAFENYDDIKAGDVIECYEITSEAATLQVSA